MPLDLPVDPLLASVEAQDAYLEAAFATRHPVLVADAVNTVARARTQAGIASDDAWETTFELFHSAANNQHLFAAFAKAGAYRDAAGLTGIGEAAAAE